MAAWKSPLHKHLLRATYQPPTLARSHLIQLQQQSLTPITSSRHRRMASSNAASNPSKNEWMVLVPDHPNALAKRTSVRPQHLENIKPAIASRTLVFGGATMAKHPEEGESPQMNGSFILIQADTKEQALEILRNDVYTKNGVWNIDQAQVWPFKSAFRTPV